MGGYPFSVIKKKKPVPGWLLRDRLGGGAPAHGAELVSAAAVTPPGAGPGGGPAGAVGALSPVGVVGRAGCFLFVTGLIEVPWVNYVGFGGTVLQPIICIWYCVSPARAWSPSITLPPSAPSPPLPPPCPPRLPPPPLASTVRSPVSVRVFVFLNPLVACLLSVRAPGRPPRNLNNTPGTSVSFARADQVPETCSSCGRRGDPCEAETERPEQAEQRTEPSQAGFSGAACARVISGTPPGEVSEEAVCPGRRGWVSLGFLGLTSVLREAALLLPAPVRAARHFFRGRSQTPPGGGGV